MGEGIEGGEVSRDPLDEIHAEALRAAAREVHGTWRQAAAEVWPTVPEMLRERYPAAAGQHVGRPGKSNRKRRGL